MSSGGLVSSFVVKINPENYNKVSQELGKITDLEVHAYEHGKFVITLNSDNEDAMLNRYKHLKNTHNILSVDLVFTGFDDGISEPINGDVPNWLNEDIDARKIKYSGNPGIKF